MRKSTAASSTAKSSGTQVPAWQRRSWAASTASRRGEAQGSDGLGAAVSAAGAGATGAEEVSAVPASGKGAGAEALVSSAQAWGVGRARIVRRAVSGRRRARGGANKRDIDSNNLERAERAARRISVETLADGV